MANIGKLVGQILALHSDTEADFNAWHAPSELWPKVQNSLYTATHKLIRDAGYPPNGFVEIVANLTTEGWVHLNGLARCVPVARCRECGGPPQLVVGEHTTGGHDPWSVVDLACGHSAI